MSFKQRLGSLAYYLILLVAALFFLFPFLWMFVTSFKVPGTGDKFIYIPTNKISFVEVQQDDLRVLGFDLDRVSALLFSQKIRDLYKPGSIPSWQQIEGLISDILQRKLSSSEKNKLRDNFAPQYDINKADLQLFNDLGFSNREAQIIVNYREQNGDYDNPSNLREIPLLSPRNLRLLRRWFSSDPKIILNLDEPTRYKELGWSEMDIQIYREFRGKYGISTRNLRDFEGQSSVKALRSEALEKANRLFFSNKLYTLRNYKKILGHHPRGDDFTFGRAFLNSLMVSIGTAFLTILLCTLGGYVFAKKQFTGKTYLYITFWASMMIPGMMFIVPQYVIITKLEWVNSLQGMIIPHAANIFGLYLMKQYIEQIPHSLFEAAIIDGAGELDLFRIIIIPLTMPILMTLFLMTFLAQWSNFLWQLIVNTPDSAMMTLPVALSYLKGQHNTDWTTLMAGSAVMLIPIVILFLATQKYFVAGMTAGAVKE